MHNKEKDRYIKEMFKQDTYIPEEANQKIQNLYTKLEAEKTNNIYEFKKEVIGMSKKRFVGLAASIVLTLFIGGNVLAYIGGAPNLISFALDKFGISQEYQENAKEVGITKESDGTKITLLDYAINDDILIVGYKLQTDKKFEYEDVEIVGTLELIDVQSDNKIDYKFSSNWLGNHEISAEKINENEYLIYKIYDLNSTFDLPDKMKMKIDISRIGSRQKFDGERAEGLNIFKISGSWNFEIDIEKNKNAENMEEYILNNTEIKLNDNSVLEILNVKTTEMANILAVSIISEEAKFYKIEIKDKENNILINKNSKYLDSMVDIERIIMKKSNIDEDLYINIYEYNTDKLLGTGVINIAREGKIALNTDTKYSDYRFNDLEIKIPETWKKDEEGIRKVNFDMEYLNNLPNEIYIPKLYNGGEKISFECYKYYNNKRAKFLEYCFIEYFKKPDKISLKNIKEQIIINDEIRSIVEDIVDIGETGKDGHGFNVKCQLTRNEVYNLILNKESNITKGNITVTREDLAKSGILEKDYAAKAEKTTINGLEGYRIIETGDGYYMDKYVFVKNNDVYMISYERPIKETRTVINSMQIK